MSGVSALTSLSPEPDTQYRQLRLDEPVIVLTCGRSGSTLLRFILDAHPQLACPPETGVVEMCSRLGAFWKTIDGPAPGVRPGLSDLAMTSIRNWVTVALGTYLVRQGKSRWCDKSIGSADSAAAARFLELFPKAKFICLYRQCMDVIDSILEACPWGLRGYGVEPYAVAHPGNSVAAVADFWATKMRAIADFEDRFPDSCLRVRYEDLVADPDGEAARIFSFLQEDVVPDITRTCFTAERQYFGPADYKIWATSAVHGNSVGRGSRIPAQTIPLPILAVVNRVSERLDYQRIDERWTVTDMHWPQQSGLAARDAAGAGAAGPAGAESSVTHPVQYQTDAFDEIEKLLLGWLTSAEGAGTQDDEAGFVITATLAAAGDQGHAQCSWRVSPDGGLVRMAAPSEGAEWLAAHASGWEAVADIGVWESVLTGALNVGSALRQGYVRFTSAPDMDKTIPPQLRVDPRNYALGRLFAAGPKEKSAAVPG